MGRPTSFLSALILSALTLTAQPPSEPAGAAAKPPDFLTQLSSSLEKLSRRASRSVVQIVSNGYALSGGDTGDTTTSAALISKERSTGSGVILTPDGYIVTNAHVVKGARRIQVQLPLSLGSSVPHRGGRHRIEKTMEAKLVGIDHDTDLAVLKIARTGLPHLDLGDSDLIRQGELVLALGNPLGLQNSVSLGVVSSTGRQLKPDDPMVYIQTDAAINPGNSGGPLLDTDGRVVGINTFIFTQSGGSEGIGFSIPSNIVWTVFSQIRKKGHVHRGQIGVYAQTITPEIASGLGLPRDWGVVLADVSPGGPAAEAGARVGDMVLSLNGRPMANARQLEMAIYRRPVGEKVTLKVLRGDEDLTIEIPVIEVRDDPERFADMVTPENNMVARLGILAIAIDDKVAHMMPDLRRHYGVLVAARSSAPGPDASLQPGDVIYSVNNTPVTNVPALRSLLDGVAEGQSTVLQIERDGRLMYLAVSFE